MRDPRPDGLLDQCGRLFWKLNVALAWSDGFDEPGSKTCSRGWKKARRLREHFTDENQAAGFFKERARSRNPALVASTSLLDLVEYDGGPAELDVKHGIPLMPETVGWQSRRGPHWVFRTPEGETPVKIQVDESGVLVASDGYLICMPAWRRELDVVYVPNGTDKVAELPAQVRAHLLELGHGTHNLMRRRLDNGEPVPVGERTDTIKLLVLRLIREGAPCEHVLERALAFNRARSVTPLDEQVVRKNVKGLLGWAAKHPTEIDRARERARRSLRDHEQPPKEASRTARAAPRTLTRRPLRTIEAERVELIDGTPIPLGTITLYAGIGGLGKSALALAHAKHVTDTGASVLVISYEDAAGAVIRPRFEALGGDLDKLYVLQVDPLEGEVSFPVDLAELDRHARETEARFVIIDPVSASIDLKLDAHRDQDVRVVLGQIARLAEREQLAVGQIAHLNKAPGVDPYFRINGSTAFYNAARLVMTVTPDPADPDMQRIVAAHKFNYGAVPAPERWRVAPTTINSPLGPIDVMTLEFIEVADDVAREDVLAPPKGKTALAVRFLQDTLQDGEWHDSDGLKTLARASVKVSARTLERAAQELQVEHERRGFPSSTWWRTPQLRQPLPTGLGATEERA